MSWNFFDKIYCINLYTRNDRYESCKALFERLNIPVQFVRVHPHENGAQGCFESHVKIVNDALQNNCSNIVIFEDDLDVSGSAENVNQKIGTCVDFISKNKFDIFYLGVAPDMSKHDSTIVDKDKGIYKVHSLRTHAYAMSADGMRKVKDLEYVGTPIDVYYRDNLDAFGIYPSIFYQNNSESSIELQNSRNKFYGLSHAYLRASEFYSFHVGWSIRKLLFLLGVLVLISVICKIPVLGVVSLITFLIIVKVYFRGTKNHNKN